jgi:hypothetical protein
VKEEPKSPSQVTAGRKRKAYSTVDSTAIGTIDGPINIDFGSAPPVGKRARTATSKGASVRFDGVLLTRATRQSTRSAKAAAKKDVGELFKQLGRQFGEVAKTCEDIADAMN